MFSLFFHSRILSFFSVFLMLVFSTSACAEIIGTGLRIWTTEPGQKSTSAYMVLTASEDIVVLNVTSSRARQAAFFRTVRVGDTLRMKLMERLPLSAGNPVDFTAEGYQLILSGFDQVIRAGETIPVTLEFMGKDQHRQMVTLSFMGHPFNE
ncbi:copper chaperone PCu(A)C [Methylobacillus sp.]|uniref:copper chaperone PCu(A)C n=1 Tax=Methylobacillus sp. TaxID=56818 RepID=UPI0012CE6801|nr:copper chaperone PCu(A)C [Methylobacillus sp.]MPS49918.1 copper chaperone PCu(A)C [Methylobacillus sp.]